MEELIKTTPLFLLIIHIGMFVFIIITIIKCIKSILNKPDWYYEEKRQKEFEKCNRLVNRHQNKRTTFGEAAVQTTLVLAGLETGCLQFFVYIVMAAAMLAFLAFLAL